MSKEYYKIIEENNKYYNQYFEKKDINSFKKGYCDAAGEVYLKRNNTELRIKLEATEKATEKEYNDYLETQKEYIYYGIPYELINIKNNKEQDKILLIEIENKITNNNKYKSYNIRLCINAIDKINEISTKFTTEEIKFLIEENTILFVNCNNRYEALKIFNKSKYIIVDYNGGIV